MKNIVIIADSSVDLNEQRRKEARIAGYVKGILTRPDGSQFYADCDWQNMTPSDYFDSMKKGKVMYKSATGTLNETIEAFEKELAKGNDIIAITIGSAFSAVNNLFNSAKNLLEEKYPERSIRIVDSMRYSGGYALLCYRAKDLIEEGKDIDEIVDTLNKEKNCIHQIGVLDDLFFLNKSGRITKTIAVMGTMVGVRPMADFYPNGFASVIGKVKGEKNALGVAVKYINKTIRNNKYIIIADSNRVTEADYYEEIIRKDVKADNIIRTSVGQVSGANIGPGLVAAFYFGDEVTSDSEKEKKIFEEALNS